MGMGFLVITYGSNIKVLLATCQALDIGSGSSSTRNPLSGYFLLSIDNGRDGAARDLLTDMLLSLGGGAAFDGSRVASDLLLLVGDVGDGGTVKSVRRHLCCV